ncbi:hypothetical protein ACFLS1_10265 [Verrucomicrobiota bacterium]
MKHIHNQFFCVSHSGLKNSFLLTVILFILLFPGLASTLQFGDFIYDVTTNDTITITDYTGAGGDVVIPGTIYGTNVTSI